MWQAVYNYRGYEIVFVSEYGEQYLPQCACQKDAGFDLRLRLSDPQPFPEGLKPVGAYIDGVWKPGKAIEAISWQNSLLIPAGHKKLVNTGLRWMVFPKGSEPNEVLALLLLPRSGLACKTGLTLINGVGLVDMKYSEEIKVCLWNTSEFDHYLNENSRIAQGVVATFASFSFENEKERQSGFGHTGV